MNRVCLLGLVIGLAGCTGGPYPANAPIGAAFGERTLAPDDIPALRPAADGTLPDSGEAIVPNGLPVGVSGVTAAGSENGVVGVTHLPPF